ncbi:initiation control protein YabA [Ignavigranum ruoffiae]|uniref:initiation control protein YabA n=1 Tax=Ignavigranum ruoffiae TaxID=89093 RepID=UPI00204DEC62|nr:initiation control protein YabA [Ignavigranum ruoffiae]UPQ86499.1 initiation control protein YabA [Ignavigranum ruoffiae]
MEHEEVFEIIERAERQMLDLSDSVANLRKELLHLIEENNQLRMSNHDLHDLILNQSQAAPNQTNQADLVNSSQQKNQASSRLQSYYDEGIHVCHQLFGARRETGEECILCLGVLDELKK